MTETADLMIIIIFELVFIAVVLIGIGINISNNKGDNKTHELLNKIYENTRDKTVPLKPQGVDFQKSDIKWGRCPICRNLINSHNKHCGECGTEIDWSDTE